MTANGIKRTLLEDIQNCLELIGLPRVANSCETTWNALINSLK